MRNFGITILQWKEQFQNVYIHVINNKFQSETSLSILRAQILNVLKERINNFRSNLINYKNFSRGRN